MKLSPIEESSQLSAAGYDEIQEVMVIQFKKGAAHYQYDAVPIHIYDSLLLAESRGGFFNRYIRSVYSYKQITAEQVEAL